MERFTIRDILNATGGTLTGQLDSDAAVTDVCIDSRLIVPGALFVPIVGEKFDGHTFIETAFAQGAVSSLTQEPAAGGPLIHVADTAEALKAIAGAYRDKFPIPVVGVTGSVGKTTTKELIYSVLSQAYTTHKNSGNLNNQTGVPLTLLALNRAHQAAVVEMGTNHFGEIAALARIVRPDVCVFTNIGEAHIEYLGSKEGILRAKCEMLDYRAPDAPVILNGDDELLRTLRGKYPHTVTYGTRPCCDVYAADIEEMGLDGSRFIAHFPGGTLPVTIPAPGSHMVLRALCALSVGLALNVPPDAIARGIAAYAPVSGRMAVIRTGRFTLLNDAYNANPSSVTASIDVATSAAGRRVLILGDMFELGKDELKYHYEIGCYAVQKNADLILCTGALSHATYKGALESGGVALYFEDKLALKRALPSLLRQGDTILVKASNGMKLQDVAAYIQETC